MKVLSLFDGMACGMLAMMDAGVNVDRYVAFEIDKYAVQTSIHNFPMIEHRGDVFKADFTEFYGFDFLVGGSPCTYWSIAQKNNRETEASGMGWELFSQYVRALKEAQPMYFIYENNKSMSNAIRESITETFGFEPVCINSSLVSAQNRQRLYWVGRRNADGTYSKVNVEQPQDRKILLRDILDGVTDREKGRCVLSSIGRTTTREYFEKNQGTMTFEPVASTVLNVNPSGKGINGAVGRIDAKSRCLTTNKGEGQKIIVPVAQPTGIGYRGRMEDGKWVKRYESREDEKANALTTAQTDSMVAEPVNTTADGKAQCVRATCYKDGIRNLVGNVIDRRTAVAEPVGTTKDGKSYCLTAGYANGSGENIGNYAAHTIEKGCKSMVAEPCRVGCYPSPDGTIKNSQGMRIYSVDGKSVNITAQGGGMGAKTGLYAIPCCNMPVKEATKKGHTEIKPMACVNMTQPNSKTRRGRNMADKSNCCMTSCQYYQYCGVLAYATPCEWDENGNATKAVSVADGKKYAVYEVNDGYITIKGKTYPIKLVDGFYIIRKLTVRECMRLQTVPEWYEFPVSDSQAYKMLGNGWTVLVISHLIKSSLV